jgi:glycosyltransferase involved in cell wall biosynthesis
MTRTAIVHDYLTQCGGAERVVLRLAALLPDAPIYTSIYDPKGTYDEFRNLDVHTTSLQGHVPPRRFRLAAPLYPRVFSHLDLSEFDRVVVSTSGFAHFVHHPRAYVYCYTPPRFLYATESYIGRRAVARVLPTMLGPLRRLDRNAARRQHEYAATSHVTADRIRTVYGREAPVIHPPLSTAHLPSAISPMPATPRALVISRLLPYKRIDLAIAACARLRLPLSIVGAGPDEARLRGLSGPDVSFLGRVDDTAFSALFAAHSVILAPGVEDFGYGPVEAAYAGRPVVAVKDGGALETVIPGVTGELVSSDDPAEWADVIADVLRREWPARPLREATLPFRPSVFAAQILAWLDDDQTNTGQGPSMTGLGRVPSKVPVSLPVPALARIAAAGLAAS